VMVFIISVPRCLPLFVTWGAISALCDAALVEDAVKLPHSIRNSVDGVRIDPATGQFVDTYGRVRVFHGVNVVYKKAPWLPSNDSFDTENSLVAEDMERLADWGFNVIRLGVMWPGLETSPGHHDTSYLERVEALVEQLSQYGVYTIADLHQDLLARHFCGEGVPEFYVDDLLLNASSLVSQAPPFPQPSYPAMPLNASGFPALSDCLVNPFADYYRSDRVGALFRELYTPGTPLHQGFVEFWRAVALRFKGGATAGLLGYELMNEPSAQCLQQPKGSIFDCKPLSAYFGSNQPEEQYMAPLWRAAAAAIRESDPDRPVMYEADPSPMLAAPPFNGPVLGDDPQQVLAYHVYCEPGDGKDLAARLECLAAQTVFSDEYFGFLKKHGRVGGVMTEFGAVGSSAGEISHLNRLLGIADDHVQSWAYWQLKKYQDFTTMNDAESLYWPNGTLEETKLKTLSRTYAQAIAGLPLRMSFDPITAVFELRYNATVSEAPTEVYLNEVLHYPQGFAIDVDPKDCATLTLAKNRVHATTSSQCIGEVITLRLSPNSTQAN